MKLKPWTIGFYVDGERRDTDAMPIFTFWTKAGAEERAHSATVSHRNMYGDRYAEVGRTLEYRAVRR
jgi:hypothetical protein